MADRLTRRFQNEVARIGNRAGVLTARQFDQLESYDDADVETFARGAAPALVAAKTAAVATGVAFYARKARLRTIPGISAAEVPTTANAREPFISYWRALKSGNTVEDARLSGLARAAAIARNLATSSARLAGPVVLERYSDRPVHGWIRVPDGAACDWCIAAAEAFYASAADADIGHDRCGCSIEPAY